MKHPTTFFTVVFTALGCAFFATAQVVPNRDSAEYYSQRGASFYESPGASTVWADTRRRRAIADYTKSIAFDSSYYWSYRNRGYCYQNIGEYELALADYERAIQVSRRQNGETLDYLHSRCAAMCIHLEQWAAAETHCSAFLAMPGYDSTYYHSVWRSRAEVRVKLQKYAAARQDYVIYQRQTATELLTEEKNLTEIQQNAVTQSDLRHLPKRDRTRALAHYKEYLAEQEATVGKLRVEHAAITTRIAELENLIR